MKQQQKTGDKEIEIESSQSFSYIWKKLKNSIFDVLFIILDNMQEEGGSMVGLCLETGVDYIQMFSFPFSENVLDVWNANQTLSFINLANMFNIFSYIPGISFSSYMVGLYALVFLIIVVMCDIVYVAYSFSQKRFKFTWPLMLLAKIVPLIVTVMFQPIMETLLNIVNCSAVEGESYQALEQFPQIICWEGWHIFHATIILIFSFLFVCVSCIVTLALFEPRMTSNRLTARQNSTGQVIFIINKIICQFIFSFSPFEGSLPYCILLFALSGWLFYAYNFHQPYYDKHTTKFFSILSTYYFWTNLMLLVSQIFTPFGFQDGFVLWLCGMIFIGMTIFVQNESSIDKILASNLKFKSGQELESHLQYVLLLHHNRNLDKNSYMLLLGYIQKHIQLCLQENCPLKYNKSKFSNGKQEEDYSCKQLLKQLQKMFVEGLKKYPSCTKLRLTFAFFYMEQYENNSKAYEHFTKALSTDPSFGEQFIIYRFRKIIGENLQQSKEEQEADLIELIRFDNHVSLCEENMLTSGKLHKEFWLQLKEQSPNLDRLNFIGARIIETSEIIKDNYKEIVRLSHDDESILYLQYNYALYQLFIAHQTVQGNKILQCVNKKYEKKKQKEQKIYKKLKQDKIQQIMLTKKSLIVTELDYENESEDSFCIIKRVNQRFLELVKYREEDLINQKLEMILPKIFAKGHDLKIREWLENEKMAKDQQPTKNVTKFVSQRDIAKSQNGSSTQNNPKEKYIETKRVGYIRDSSGFIRKVKYEVYFIPLEAKFITEMELYPFSSQNCYLICDPDGIILEMSQTTLYRFSRIHECVEIQKLLKLQFIEELKTSSQKAMYLCIQGQKRVHLGKKQRKIYECNIQRVQVCYKGIAELQQMAHNFKIQDTLQYKSQQEQSKFIGMIINIICQQQYLTASSIKSGFLKTIRAQKTQQKIEQIQANQTKKSTIVSGLTKVIQQYYNEYEELDLEEQLEDINSAHDETAENRKPKTNYALYYKEEDKKQHIIKVYRYFGGEMQRIYYDDLLQQESDYDFEEKVADLQAKLSKQKLLNPAYQQRIKNSINTFIYHPEIVRLFSIGILIFLTFNILHFVSYGYFSGEVIDQGVANIKKISNNVEDVKIITSSLSETLFETAMTENNYQLLKKHIMQFQYIYSHVNNKIENFMLEDSSKTKIDLLNALTLFQADLLKFYQDQQQLNSASLSNVDDNLQTTFYSYLTGVQEVISNSYPIQSHQTSHMNVLNNSNIICAALMAFFGFSFILFWVYENLAIKFKIFSVLLWFLDIPFEYINYAEKQCLRFTKNYLQVQKNHEKSQKEIQQSDYLTIQYKQKVDFSFKNDSNDETSNDQNSKARQLIISKYKHHNTFSMFTKSQFSKCILFLIFQTFLIVMIILQININQEASLISTSINSFMKQYIWVQSLPMALRISKQKQMNQSTWNVFPTEMLEQINSKISENIITSTKGEVEQIRQNMINQFVHKYPQFINNYLQFDYSDLCQNKEQEETSNSTIDQQNHCSQFIGSRFRGGYSVVLAYIKTETYNLTLQQINQLEQGLRVYTYPIMFSFLQQLAKSSYQQIESNGTRVGIAFYIFMVIMIFAFLIPWNIYLRRLNLKVNQTIQILNVFPISLIPVSRVRTREFLKWITLKASQQYDNQEEE